MPGVPLNHRACWRIYERIWPWLESASWERFRPEMLAGLHGRVLEIGPGMGTNFAHYPPEVSEVVAMEPDDRLRRHAADAAAAAGVRATVIDGAGDELPFPDASFDAAVTSLVLCSVEDPSGLLAELHRVIRPGGQLHFFEHVRSSSPRFARIQRTLDVAWPHLSGGCHTSRATDDAIVAAGFEPQRMRRAEAYGNLFEYPAKPKVVGVARRG